VAAKLLELYPSLTSNDIRATPSGVTGPDLLLSQAAKVLVPAAIECKNHKSFAIYKHYDQARSHVKGSEFPMLVIRQNRSEPLVCVSLNDFIRILSGSQKSNKNQ
jgi:hypothetical protein